MTTIASPPADPTLPLGFRVALDRRVRVRDGGAVLIGGAPPRLVRLAPAARRLLAGGAFTVTDPTTAALARRLLDGGIVHPVPAESATPADEMRNSRGRDAQLAGTGCATRGDGMRNSRGRDAQLAVTVVVPVKDRTDGLRRLLAVLRAGDGGGAVEDGGGAVEVVVVDDGSADPAAVRAVAEAAGARVLRHEVARGPAAARNAGAALARTPLVAFLDSDVVPQPGWLRTLAAHFADPAVALAAPRIVALPPVSGVLGRYEAVRSSLDLGPDPALIVPRTRVAYVPSAALVLRRDALGAGFDERLHVAEDVDLVLRLHAAGWRLRYDPSARVAHDHRTSPRAWWLRKAFYGTGAAPLASRHAGSVPPMVLTPWAAAVSVLALTGRPRALLVAAGVGAVATERLARSLGAPPLRETVRGLAQPGPGPGSRGDGDGRPGGGTGVPGAVTELSAPSGRAVPAGTEVPAADVGPGGSAGPGGASGGASGTAARAGAGRGSTPAAARGSAPSQASAPETAPPTAPETPAPETPAPETPAPETPAPETPASTTGADAATARGTPPPRTTPLAHPRATAALLVTLGAAGAVGQTVDAVNRHYWPVAALACLVSRRARRTVLVIAVAEGVVDWWRADPRDRPSLPAHVLARRLDDVAYGSGLWWGAVRHRTVAPLLPGRPGPPRTRRDLFGPR